MFPTCLCLGACIVLYCFILYLKVSFWIHISFVFKYVRQECIFVQHRNTSMDWSYFGCLQILGVNVKGLELTMIIIHCCVFPIMILESMDISEWPDSHEFYVDQYESIWFVDIPEMLRFQLIVTKLNKNVCPEASYWVLLDISKLRSWPEYWVLGWWICFGHDSQVSSVCILIYRISISILLEMFSDQKERRRTKGKDVTKLKLRYNVFVRIGTWNGYEVVFTTVYRYPYIEKNVW